MLARAAKSLARIVASGARRPHKLMGALCHKSMRWCRRYWREFSAGTRVLLDRDRSPRRRKDGDGRRINLNGNIAGCRVLRYPHYDGKYARNQQRCWSGIDNLALGSWIWG